MKKYVLPFMIFIFTIILGIKGISASSHRSMEDYVNIYVSHSDDTPEKLRYKLSACIDDIFKDLRIERKIAQVLRNGQFITLPRFFSLAYLEIEDGDTIYTCEEI